MITEGELEELKKDIEELRAKYPEVLIKVLILDRNAPYDVLAITKEILQFIAYPER